MNELLEIIIDCQVCKEPFETLLVVKDGNPYDFCCSISCYYKWNDIENVRDRKINSLLE